MAKRRLISLLPSYQQTDDLTNFFGSTVDEVFQPGTSEPLSGYIGHRAGADPQDFYVPEPDGSRSAYQLEPGMVSYNTPGAAPGAVLSYPDFIGYLETNGADVSDHQRLTETEYYTYAPPISIDALINYHQYYWFGDINGSADLPILDLTIPVNHLLADGATLTFAMPLSINAIPIEDEAPSVIVNGVAIDPTLLEVDLSVSYQYPYGSITITDAAFTPPSGADVIVTRVANFAQAITSPSPTTGQITSAVNVADINSHGVQWLSSGMRIRIIDAQLLLGGWDAIDNDISIPWDARPVTNWKPIAGISGGGYAGALFDGATSGLPDDGGFPWDYGDGVNNGIFMVDGIGLSVRLTPDAMMERGIKAQYVTVDRSSIDRNEWSLHNMWVHRDTFAWATDASFITPLSQRQATRPIIEFIRDLELWHIDVTLTVTAQADYWDIHEWDAYSWDAGDLTFALDAPLPNVVGRQVFGYNIPDDTFVTEATDTLLSMTKIPLGDIPAGTTISIRQGWQESIDPLFMLYDLNDTSLDDLDRYPGSTFLGSTIFDYTLGSGKADPILLRPLSFDDNGYFIFDNKTVTERYSYNNGAISGMYAYATNDGVTKIIEPLWHAVRGTTTQGTTNGYFDVPLNLHANPLSDDVSTISRSTWTAHFTSIIANQPELVGQPNAANNYRDTSRDLTLGTQILQHRAPLLKAMLLAANSSFDLPQSIRYAEQEYNRFRNKFSRKLVDLYHRGTLRDSDPTNTWVTTALQEIKRDKTAQFPFAFNTVAGGNYFIPPTPTCLGILPAAVPAMVIDTSYLTPVLMILGHDGSLTPAFSTLFTLVADATSSTTTLAVGNTKGVGIGRTVSTTSVIGRIVSITDSTITIDTPLAATLSQGTIITVNDWRDPIMLALEQTIYSNLPSQFRTEARPGFDIQQWIGSRFFNPFNGYSRDEVTQMLMPWFELWVQQNQFDYRTHIGFSYGDPFTWNYRGVLDRGGMPLPGYWRAIYRYYFGTDVPHLRPWECLGFVSEPTWWRDNYGDPPYARTNTDLWTDLENGTIRDGPRAGTDDTYARNNLADFIPVDSNGNLLDPVAAGIVITTVPYDVAQRPWMLGDGSPVESLWTISPSYRYALAMAAFLMKPARFVEECWNVLTIGYHGNQWIDFTTLDRPLNSQQYVHGEMVNDTPLQVFGVSQWIADYMLSSGHTSDALGEAVRGLTVRLIHQMAGFTSNDDMKVVADNFGLLPSEDVNIVLYNSPSSGTEVYSGVILEWTGRGWRAIGYDARDPFFTIIPPDTNGPKGLISIATTAEPTIVKWRPNTYYPVGIFVEWLNTVWVCLRSHTSSPQFEQGYWQSKPDMNAHMIRAPRVITYLRGLDTTQRIPYGTVFYDYQSIGDFLLGWQRWLESRGWIFDDTDPQTGELRNWSLSVKEFLTWAQVQWAPGNFIALSPGQHQLKFTAASGTILNVESNTTGFFGLVDRSGRPINQRDALISRLDGDIKIRANNADVFGARLNLANIEHALVFSNITIFQDVCYLPLFDIRQSRLRLICKRSRDWAGRLDAPGFVIIGSQLKSDFEKAVEDVRTMFDIETPDRADLRDYARHVIGFQRRDYLENLLLSDVEQLEFYQGMVQQKGAPGVFEKLARSNRAANDSDLQFLEEWAVRIDEFGAPVDPFFIFQLSRTDMRNDPQIVRMIPTNNAPPNWIVLTPNDPRWLDRPNDPGNFFIMHPARPALPSAGPVRVSDATYTCFTLADVPSLYLSSNVTGVVPFAANSLTWVYERNDSSFTVLQSFETGAVPNALLVVVVSTDSATDSTEPPADSSTTRLYFQHPHTLTTLDVGNYLVVDGLSMAVPEMQGLVPIKAVTDDYVDLAFGATSGFDFTDQESTAPFCRVLREVRFPSIGAGWDPLAAVSASGSAGALFSGAASTPSTQPIQLNNAPYDFVAGNLAWIDIDHDPSWPQNQFGWTVRQYDGTTWNVVRSQPLRPDPRTISETVIFRSGTRVADQQLIINEPVVDDLVVIDPMAGLIAGLADREIDFKLENDPARYNDASGIAAANPWGANEVGRVWWNLSTVRFLDPLTDSLGMSDARDIAELKYRIANWTRIAPGSSIDVYEWIESTVDPAHYSGPGTIFGIQTPAQPAAGNDATTTARWVERTMYDETLQRDVTKFYYWVKGLTTTPNVPFRHTDISTVAMAITNPAAAGLAWMGAIDRNALIVSGIAQYLDDGSTVMKVRLTLNPDNAGRHDEWQLLRPTDETSLPSTQIWNKMRDSLAGFDAFGTPLPDHTLPPSRTVGIRQGQSMFVVDGPDGTRSGLLAARQSFVGIINQIFARLPMQRDRGLTIPTLYRSTLRANDSGVIDQHLAWTQLDGSYGIEPPPRNEWDVRVFALDARNRLLGRDDFLAAAENGTNLRVLLDGTAHPVKQWSIWEFDAKTAKLMLEADESLIANADTLYSLATAYEVVVADRTARNALTDLDIGTRVFVTNDVSNFWVIWKFLPADPNADAFGFILWRMQRYRTDDFISVVDWYSPGYSASNPPIITYDTIGARTTVEGIQPISQFVKINDDGSSEHRWIWTKYNPGSSYVVVNDALQGATILTLDHTDQIVVGQPLALANSTAVVFSTNTVVTAITATTISLNLPLVGKIQAGNQINIGGYWSTVAMQNGTIALTDDFYDPTRVPLRTIADITNRDGSWELMVLADALRYGGMLLDSEVNEVFFSILNYVHVSQDDIDWVFKTSFMVIVGYDVPLQQTPVLLADQTDNLIQYCNEVKPYHVKIRGVSTQYNTDLDVGHVHIDTNYAFDITLLFDRIDLADTWDVDAWNQYVWDDTAVDEAWDESRWQRYVWDTDIGETGMVQVYIHTIVLDVSDNQLHVADVRFLQDSALITTINPLWVNVGALYTITESQVAGVTSLPLDRTDLIMIGMPVNGPNSIIPSDAFPEDTVVTGIGIGSITLSRPTNLALKAGAVINIGDVYQIVNVEADPLAAQDALSGYVKTGVSGILTSSDTVIAAPGSLVEAMILMPDAELRIMLYDPAAQTDNADELGDLLGVNMRPIVGNYTVTTMALSGDITILLDNTSGIIVGQPVFAPSIAPDPLPVVLPNTMLGTVVTAVTSSSISLSKPLLRDLAAGSTISVSLPQTIVGPNLYLESPPDLTYQGTGLETDESDVIDVEFNPALSSRPGGFDLRSPYHDVNHPEERLPFNADDALHLSITATPTSGGPQQEVKTFDIAALTEQTILLDLIPQSNDAVMVFLDGLRVRDGYIVDQLARTVTVTLSDNERVLVHTFGVGGTSAVRDSHYHTYGVDTLTTSNAATTSNTIVVVDGIPTTDFTIASAIVTLNTPPANGTNVAIVTFHGAATTATQIHVQTDTSGASSILLDNPDIDTKPEHAGTIVEVNGLRLTPPATFYATLTPAIPWMLLPMDPTTATSVQLYVNDADYGFEIPIWQRIDTGQPPYPANLVPTGDPPLKSGPTGGIFVVVEDWLVCLQSGFTGDVTFVLERSSDEYTVEDGTVTINTSISVGDTVTLTTFSNASTMDTKTMVFDDGWLCDFPLPSSPTAALVSMNGLYLAPNIDYEILKVTSESERASLQILSSVSGTLVVTVFTGIEAGGFRQWMSNTRVPALVRMPPLLVEDRWDNLDFDDVAFDDTAEPVTEQAGFMRHGPDQTRHALYQLRNEDREASAFLAGRLTETVAPDADTIEIDLFLRDITTKLQPTDPLAVPQGIWPRVTKPGAIWIGGERIEYFGFERTDDHVSLSGLRRTTRGTTMLMQQTTLLSYGELGPDYTIAGTGTVIVTVDGIPVSFTSQTSGGNTIVTVSASADAVINIVLTPDDPFTYPVGMIVRNGDVPFNPDPPPGLRGIAEAVSL